jgi:hypothetical protein
MLIDDVYLILNRAVLPFWALLVFVPHAEITRRLVHSGIVPIVLGLVYVGFMANSMIVGGPEGAGMGTLEGLMISFTDPQAVVTGWTHYLAFDLFVGAWQVRDAKRVGIPHLAIVVPVLLTFAAGPLGLMIYLIMRLAWKKRFTLAEGDPA